MKIRNLFPLLLVAVAAAVLVPERATAQLCWTCMQCPFDPNPRAEMCTGFSPNNEPVVGATRCAGPVFCTCILRSIGFCDGREAAADSQAERRLLEETLAAIREGRAISADAPFFYVRSGADFVVRSKCDLAEVARLAVAEVSRPRTVVAG